MTIDLAGFADPVLEAQSTFRAVLDAMAHPGMLARAGAGLTPPAPLSAAAGAVLLTLVDGETALWMAARFVAARDWVGFHCGSAPVDEAALATFVLADALPDLAGLAAGSDESPDASATVILEVPALGEGRNFRLSGPGLKEATTFAVAGLPEDFPARWAANHGLFPRGIDLILTSGTTVAALPRTVHVEG